MADYLKFVQSIASAYSAFVRSLEMYAKRSSIVVTRPMVILSWPQNVRAHSNRINWSVFRCVDARRPVQHQMDVGTYTLMPFKNGHTLELRTPRKTICAQLFVDDVEQVSKVLLGIQLRETKPRAVYNARQSQRERDRLRVRPILAVRKNLVMRCESRSHRFYALSIYISQYFQWPTISYI